MNINSPLFKAVKYLTARGDILNSAELAEKMNYSTASVSRYMTGKEIVSDKFKVKFERTFDIKLEYFEPGGKNENVETPNLIEDINESLLVIKAEIATSRQMMIEFLAVAQNKSVMEVQAMADTLLAHNLKKLKDTK